MKSETSTYAGFEFEVDGFPGIAIINSDLAKLENHFEYAYSVFIDLIPDSFNEFGHPEEKEYDYLNEVEKKMIEYLEHQTNTLHVGHSTIYRKREVFFYTKDPEKVSSFLEHFLSTIERENSFDIEHDPQWENVSGFYELL